MTREEAKELLPIIQAFAEGKSIQFRKGYDWIDIKTGEDLSFLRPPSDYRIKPESKYRAFISQKECLEEMHKHPDFGWIINKSTKSIYHINVIYYDCIYLDVDKTSLNYLEAFDYYEFLNGTPFGIKE